ncbi:MAG TPA: hypothetical protein VHO27_02230 [Angustibacter sp.]|nr:hypothetical protein [Angustibacter sp.]
MSDTGPSSRVTAIHAARRPTSSHVPSTSTPPGESRFRTVCQASATSLSSYCRNTLNARTTCGRRSPGSGTSKPPSANDSPGRLSARAAATRAGSISSPTTSTSGRTRRSRSWSSTAVTGVAP